MKRGTLRSTVDPAIEMDETPALAFTDFATGVTSCTRLMGQNHPCGICVSASLRLKNPMNNSQGMSRGAVFLQNKIRKEHRWYGTQLARGLQDERNSLLFPSGYVLTLVRLAPKAFDDDNLAAAFKSIRDGIAEAFGFDDGSDTCWWEYRQEKSKEYLIRVELYCPMCWMRAEYGATQFEAKGRKRVFSHTCG